MNKYIISIILLTTISAYSHTEINGFNNDTNNISIIDAEKKYRPNKISIQNEFLFENTDLNGMLFTSGNIDNYKNTISSKLKDKNVLGIKNKFGISYKKYIPSSESYFSLGLFDRTEMDFSFSKDLFDLVFFGNKRFVGKIINLDNTSLTATRFQEINLSYSKNITLDKKKIADEIQFNIGASYLIGNSYIDFTTNQSFIEIGENGEYINSSLNFIANVSDTNDIQNFNAFKSNGKGLSLNFDIKLIKEKNSIIFKCYDLGYINWNDNSTTYSTKNNINNFSGIVLENILSLNDSIIKNQLDSLSEFNIIKENSNLKSYLNTTYHVSFQREIDLKYLEYIKLGIINKHRAGLIPTNYKTKYYLSTNSNLNSLNFKTNINIGGYSKYGVGLELSKDMLKKHLQITLGTQHFESIFKGAEISNIDLYFYINYYFGKQN